MHSSLAILPSHPLPPPSSGGEFDLGERTNDSIARCVFLSRIAGPHRQHYVEAGRPRGVELLGDIRDKNDSSRFGLQRLCNASIAVSVPLCADDGIEIGIDELCEVAGVGAAE